MILEFSVKNYKSIENKLTLNFKASNLNDNTEYQNYFNVKDFKVLKLLTLYGENASGKSTILDAVKILRNFIVHNYSCKDVYFPFLMKGNNDNTTYFDVLFITNNNIYDYEIEFDWKHVLKEKLKIKSSNKFTTIYERSNNSLYLNKSIVSSKTANLFVSSLKEDKPFLSCFNIVEVEHYSDAYKYFLNNFIFLTLEIKSNEDVIPYQIFTENFKKFAIKFLRACDIHIKDIIIEKRKIQFSYPNNPELREMNGIFFVHETDGILTKIPFIFESLGTKKMILMADMIYRSLKRESIVIIDELESSLHPDLAKLVVETFLDETLNTNNSQLLFSSHQTNLLSSYFLRRDQIVFVYKDKEKNNTYIEYLKDFSVRKNDNIEKSYLAGRFNTSPNLEKVSLWRKTKQKDF